MSDRTPCLMLQGTGSHVGKSLLLAGLARAYHRRGLNVRPFKPQNMSNNAAATADGREIGRAQALQARACGAPPCADMNPILLKPESDGVAQVIVDGRVKGRASARDYQAMKAGLLPAVVAAYERLAKGRDLILIEGAGSPAELNLRANDLANMGFAEAIDAPVALIGDVERGGVIAALAGTVGLLPASERARIRGSIVNKFRGDPRLFDGALPLIERHTGTPCLGVVPYFRGAERLAAEDSLALDERPAPVPANGSSPTIRIAVPRLPHIANFDDLDPLAAEPDVTLLVIAPGRPLPREVDLIVLPGSKASRADLAALQTEGWDIDIKAHVRQGGALLGLCGGYQMLGRTIADPDGTEGAAGTSTGLGLLAVETRLARDKRLQPVSGRDALGDAAVSGYEMHLGETDGADCARPMLIIGEQPEGARSLDGKVMGSYVHGLFAADSFRHAFLARLRDRAASTLRFDAMIDATLDELAAHLEAALPLDRLLTIARHGH